MLLCVLVTGLLGVLAFAVRPNPVTGRQTGSGPSRKVVAPIRLAIVRAALLLGAFGVLTIETLSRFDALTRNHIIAAWLLACIATAATVTWRLRRDQSHAEGSAWPGGKGSTLARLHRSALRRHRLPRWHWWTAGVVATIAAGAFILAIASAPNNFDSQTYHLPRIEHWVQQGNVQPWATAIHRQIDINPGAEYLLAHLRLVSGSDAAYNLLQFAAGIGAIIAASRICAQLGGSRNAQVITVGVLATTPEIILQATSTQVDLVTAAWVACLATVSLDARLRDLGYLALATGLVAVTKSSGLLAVGFLLLLWGIRRLIQDSRPSQTGTRASRYAKTVGASVAIVLIGLIIAGPHLWRMQTTFGHPLGPEQLHESITVQSDDPRLWLVNGLKITHTALDTPIQPLSEAHAQLVRAASAILGVDPNDEAITFGSTTWPVASWYPDEDRAALPITGLAAIIATLALMIRPNRHGTTLATVRRAYALILVLTAIAFAASVQWQPWINRLYLFLVVLAAPLIGIGIAAALRQASRLRRQPPGKGPGVTWATAISRRCKRASILVTVVALAATAALAGVLTVAYGYPRRLVGELSVFATTESEQRFMRRSHWQEQYEAAASAVADSGAQRVGLVQSNDSWEYPWWLYLPEGTTIVALQSRIPGYPPASAAEVDAIVCAEALQECQRLAPPNWDVYLFDDVGYALPPARRLSFPYVAFRPRYSRRRQRRTPASGALLRRTYPALQRRRASRPPLSGVQQPEVHAY
ncbi:hypothetical protein [Natronoglycomyces albus]|uniref:hypothetical protein n=1 Tax=Natronoglycomyces albus TaxID=2811108 RepID=UPI001FEACE29|nr:hypothetical protein [Natronoglycomyces albus]